MRRPLTITERMRNGYTQGLVVGAALGFFLAHLPPVVVGFLTLAGAGCYATYQVVRWAMEA